VLAEAGRGRQPTKRGWQSGQKPSPPKYSGRRPAGQRLPALPEAER
jgi:hypothetical protein